MRTAVAYLPFGLLSAMFFVIQLFHIEILAGSPTVLNTPNPQKVRKISAMKLTEMFFWSDKDAGTHKIV
jgi:hypothetical protein